MSQETDSGSVQGSSLGDLKAGARTAMCPVCRCVGTIREYVRPSTGDCELVCLRCGTSLRVDVTTRDGSVSKLVVMRVARLRDVRPAGDPLEVEVGKELTLDRWHELVKPDPEIVKRVAHKAVRHAKTSPKTAEWKGKYAKAKRDPAGYLGLASLVVLLVLPILIVFSHLTLLQAGILAAISGLVLVATFKRTFGQSPELGSAELPILISPENESYLIVATKSALSTVGIEHRIVGDPRGPADSLQVSCERGSFMIAFEREKEPSPQPILLVKVGPLSRQNAKLAERACKALGLAFIELGFYLKPISPASGGVAAIETGPSGKASF